MRFHGYYILSTQPLIVSYLGSYPFFGGVIYQDKKIKFKPLPNWFRPKHVIEHSPYWCASPKQMLLRKTKSIIHSLEGRTHHFMVNAKDEEQMRKLFQIRGAHFNQNFYINEHLYNIIEQPKVYDAIYTAQLNSSKRLPLAKNVEKLMVVSYGGDLHAYCPELKHADYNKDFISRPELAKKYNQAFSNLNLKIPHQAPNRTHVYYKYTIVTNSPEQRIKLEESLASQGIQTERIYPRLVPEQPVYLSSLDCRTEAINVSKNISERLLCLPIYPEMKNSEVDDVIEAMCSVTNKALAAA